ncbi:hypothetical protein L210DRAFT_3400485 [Boletus edulis BED1]|uniref:Choline/carnitine acyltransferase domain-containing protein n=1 Tax=Boletus edulis BED1 TaxID=1328754 RepID=A0AAD4BDB8_BOLED|nr:hypothetical protein L210DRAFT_3425591 [Boletus edulis BED1]KAF8419842.1 hypothetical protein L210DRAFT_3425554 [Boletus edulis BED1]KAF8423431.1 hypothetical protein L210DRAFT_3422839 [Boletus edulis BED1]KAF8440765.1 hypothetical protein L210DRAFT_3400485 [Boletus edulis BED1]
MTKFHLTPGSTFANRDALPKLPIPPLEDTCNNLTALRGLQDDEEHAATTLAVQKFREGDGPALQERLKQWAAGRASYLSHTDPVVLAFNPFFVLENDPTPNRGSQLPRAAALIISSLGFIHDLRAGLQSRTSLPKPTQGDTAPLSLHGAIRY